MMPAQRHEIFKACARQLDKAFWDKHFELFREANKLEAYNTLLEPPASIRKANVERIKRLREQLNVLWDLHKEAEKADDYVTARPSIHSYTSEWDGRERSFVLAGLLPNCERAPEDEAQALQAVDEYFARKEALTA